MVMPSFRRNMLPGLGRWVHGTLTEDQRWSSLCILCVSVPRWFASSGCDGNRLGLPRLRCNLPIARWQRDSQVPVDEKTEDADRPLDHALHQRAKYAAGHGRAQPLVEHAESQF